jgi:thioredoxin 1
MPALTTVTDQTFEHEIAQHEGLAVVDFWAEWCGPCRLVGPTINQLAIEFQGRAKVAKLNVDASPRTTDRFGVRTIPTLLFFRHGKVVDRVVGVAAKSVLARRLEQHLSAGPEAAA